MKHLLNNLSEEEKNRIREQHEGGMKVNTEKFKSLLESKSGNVKPLLNEQTSLNVDLLNIANKVLSKNKITKTPNKMGESVTVWNKQPLYHISISPSSDEKGKYTIRVTAQPNIIEKFSEIPSSAIKNSSGARYDVSLNDLESSLNSLISKFITDYPNEVNK